MSPPDRCFDGFDGYKKLLECVDVVLLCTPPGFRPLHLRAAIEAGKHVFCEKPVAVDAPGVASVIESAKLAKEKNLCLCSGYCYRYDHAKRETVKRIHDGAIGDVTAMHITYHTGPLWDRGPNNKYDTMEYQMRNWYYFTWLSGDFIVEQHCHNFDKANWVLKGAEPIAGHGRRRPAGPHRGEVRQHLRPLRLHARIRRRRQGLQRLPPDGRLRRRRQRSRHRHQGPGPVDEAHGDAVPRHALGLEGEPKSMYQVEHDELFAGIRSGKLINDGEAAGDSLDGDPRPRGSLQRPADHLEAVQGLETEPGAEGIRWGANPVPGVPLPGTYKFV